MDRIRRLADLPHSRNVLINTVGNYLGFAFAGFYTIFLVRVFDPVEFGVLSVLLTFSYLLATMLSFGMPASIYAHIPHYQGDRGGAIDFIVSNFVLLTALSSISLLCIFLAINFLDSLFLKTGAPPYQYMLALIGAEMYIWQNFIRDVLNASGKFLHINVATNISNLIRAIVLVALAVYGLLDINAVLIINGVLGPLIVFAYVIYHRQWIPKAFTAAKVSRSLIQLRFTFTYFISTQLFQLATRADLFMVSYFLTRPDVGFYGLAQRVILAVVTSTDSITQVMSPQFARIHSQKDVKNLLKHSYVYMLIPSLMFLGGMLLPTFVYTLVFGAEYTQSTFIIKSLSFAYIPFSFIAVLLLFFLYTIKKPLYVLKANAILFVFIVILNGFFIPKLRLLAPPIVFFSAFMIVLVYLLSAFKKEVSHLPRE